MSSIKLTLAVFAVSLASAAAGSGLLTDASAIASATPHSTQAQPESTQVLHVQTELRRVRRPHPRPQDIRVRPNFRRCVQPALRRAQPERAVSAHETLEFPPRQRRNHA